MKSFACVSLLALISLTGWADDNTVVKRCAQENVDFYSNLPRMDADVTGQPNSHIPLLHQHPSQCASPDDQQCKGKAYLLPGDKVVVANICGDYTHIQYVGKSRTTSGWILNSEITNTHQEPIEGGDFPISKELVPFVEKGANVVNVITGDLNKDGRQDFLMVLERDPPDDDRILIVIIRQEDGSLKVEGRNQSVIESKGDEGTHGGFEVTAGFGFFDVEDSSGDARMGKSHRFRFEWVDKKNNWMLVKVTDSEYDADNDVTLDNSRVVRTSKQLGEISFTDFDGSDF